MTENGAVTMAKDVDEMTKEEVLDRIIRLGFDGDRRRFRRFCKTMQEGLPEGTGVALRGSVVTNERYEDGSPFDANGKGTSDLDVTLIGSKVMECWDTDGFYIPGLHTKPLGDNDPDIAPSLNKLRTRLQRMVKRPVNFQATSNLVLFARDVLFNQPYFTIINAAEEET
ncbi:MAG TPA: hypothetical protein VF131_16480 [Blastocatellia bacterium]|nr:hypothetical protein [Blastocatellia bacterium]